MKPMKPSQIALQEPPIPIRLTTHAPAFFFQANSLEILEGIFHVISFTSFPAETSQLLPARFGRFMMLEESVF